MAARSRAINLDENPSWVDILNNQTALIDDLYYALRNRGGSVAPGVARAANNTGLKTANNTTFHAGGKPQALAATDPVWALTGGNLAIGSFRKYRLLHDGTTATVQASSDAASAAACDFSARPADGVAILSVATIQNGSAAVFIPATTALNAAGITLTVIDGTDSLELLAAKLVV